MQRRKCICYFVNVKDGLLDTVYSSDGKVLYIDTGFLNKKQDEIRLYRILDIGYSANLIQRIFGLGTISLRTSDKSAGSIDLVNVKDAMGLKKVLSDYVEKERMAQKHTKVQQQMKTAKRISNR